MKITLNGETIEISSLSLAELLVTYEYKAESVATAINGEFVAITERDQTQLVENDSVDVIAPMAGG